MTQAQILLIDDDVELCELLAEFLSNDGFLVRHCQSGPSALALLNANSSDPWDVDAIVLDIMMPKMNGLEVLQSLRTSHNTPVVMLTGRGDDIDRIIGLEMGADDYMGKPCNPRELAARLRSVLRRSQPVVSSTAALVALHGVVLNIATREVKVEGEELVLTSAEFSVLKLLMENAGKIISKEELTQKVLNRKLSAYDRSIDVHVSRVRQKLHKVLAGKELIKTIRGAGYQFMGSC